MSDDPNVPNKIVIDKIEGGNIQNQEDLENCYFLQLGSGNLYQFYAPNNIPIPTVPPFISDGGFFFVRDSKVWMVTKFTIDPKCAHGNWQVIRMPEQLAPAREELNPSEGDDDGAFQAQAGPTVEETASSASA